METFLLKSKNRITEKKGALNIHHCYDRKKYNLPVSDYFENLVSIRDCEIKPNMGILPHRHENIELITVPIEGTLVQKNNLGETHFLAPGNIQVMSTGSGVSHFEYNKSAETTLNCIQFCLIPNINYTQPKSDILSIKTTQKGFQQIIPTKKSDNNTQISEDLYLHYAFFEKNTTKTYQLKNKKKGILVLNINGNIEVNGEMLEDRDTLVLRNVSEITIVSMEISRFFVFEI